ADPDTAVGDRRVDGCGLDGIDGQPLAERNGVSLRRRPVPRRREDPAALTGKAKAGWLADAEGAEVIVQRLRGHLLRDEHRTDVARLRNDTGRCEPPDAVRDVVVEDGGAPNDGAGHHHPWRG